jgi:hypothetical protein
MVIAGAFAVTIGIVMIQFLILWNHHKYLVDWTRAIHDYSLALGNLVKAQGDQNENEKQRPTNNKGTTENPKM